MSLAHTTDTREFQREPNDLASTEIIELLNAEYAQQILETIRTEAKPAREIAAECGASRATVYRRLNALGEAGLVETEMRYDADGHHRSVFKTSFESLALEMTVDGLTVALRTNETERSSTESKPSISKP
ncbi:ArsR/SmtB family transcription factor [Haloarcula sp. GH36]|uniref:ArsR/SmtB family transcription factor n=1 Tax=Haloarcula montana TaxID=3111776 RepID=UPI002D77508E|nr:winged helix-turn-helix domain-containing protein [Haloarcula sp. GH36]